ncbi:protein of unknown function [Candidatus Methylomirabilis oxygeniifera]|uniref:Uncharacterized protein n=1 Tax=Methylomirabilis oxygeniifera TaxID=671143 RepID=D5MMJ1_METO1|nr:protein of unknown function [Candidatus Methylomirabilis oxyfera]
MASPCQSSEAAVFLGLPRFKRRVIFTLYSLHANLSLRTIIRDNTDSDEFFTVWDAAV